MNQMGKLAALVPLPFLALSPVFGASWAFVALFYLSVFTFLADQSLFLSHEDEAGKAQNHALLSDLLPIVLGTAHLILLPIAILTLTHADQSTGAKVVMFMAFSLFFGSVSTANAHELIHRAGWARASLGKWVFISLLFGHHFSAHLAVHHRHVATPLDPNSARLNEGFYRFFPRAWHGSFQAGLAVERHRLALTGRPELHPSNPYLIYCLGAAVFAGLVFVLAGMTGLAIYGGFALIAQTHLLLSDYVQHYGLRRARLEGEKYEPVSVAHSWNARQVFSAAVLLNAPLHSDHHAHPSLSYSNLRNRTADGAPVLPHSIPVMSCIALIPPIWKKLMNPKVAAWQAERENQRTLN